MTMAVHADGDFHKESDIFYGSHIGNTRVHRLLHTFRESVDGNML
jgi:hypothetical protein